MVKENLCSTEFTLDEILSFGVRTYPQHFPGTNRKRESVYYRRVAAYLAIENGVRKFYVAKAMNMTHPNVLWNYTHAAKQLADGEELFMNCYNDFVNKFNMYLSEKANVPTVAVNEGEPAYS